MRDSRQIQIHQAFTQQPTWYESGHINFSKQDLLG